MATGSAAVKITPARRNAGFPEAQDVPEGASQTFLSGTPVLISSGRIIAASTDAAAAIWGFAERAGRNGTAGQYKSRVYKAAPERRFTATLTGTLPATPIGTTAALVKDSGGQWYLDSGGTNKNYTVVGYDSRWVPGTDVNAEVEFVVNYDKIQY